MPLKIADILRNVQIKLRPCGEFDHQQIPALPRLPIIIR